MAPSYVPMTITSEQYQWVPGFDPGWPCVSEDDQLRWTASGSLEPGESFTFVPQYPDCNNSRAIVVSATWDAPSGARLELRSVVPGVRRLQSGIEPGVPVLATLTGAGSSRLCMFPFFSVDLWSRASVTVMNIGTGTAYDVSLSGSDANDWELNYYDACQNVDADRDGWSDSIEHGMENLTANQAELSLMGSDYLRSFGGPAGDDEHDFYPPDLDDDGAITLLDVDRVAARLGQGTGAPVSRITPNPGPDNFHLQKGAWRRFDLDGDGLVTTRDVELVRSLVGSAVPVLSTTPPTLAITAPAGTVGRGSWTHITTTAQAPGGIAKVVFSVNGALLGTDTQAPFTQWWQVPKRRGGSYLIEVTAYDMVGGSVSASLRSSSE